MVPNKDIAWAALLGDADPDCLKCLFHPVYHDFIDECNSPLHLQKITEANVNKYLKGKPELSPGKIQAQLPEYLCNLVKGFLPQDANTLPLYRPWDHKIEL